MCFCNKFIKNTLIFNKKVNTTNIFHIAYCFDDNYAMPAGLSLMSVIENNPQMNITFHLFVNGLSEANISKFKGLAKDLNCEIICYIINNNFSINSDTLVLGISVATCLRFIVPEIVGTITEKVLYLDCDTLCVGKLDELFHKNINAYIAAVVPDIDNMQKTQGKFYNIEYGKYFNAGVIYFNTTLWNKNQLTKKTFDLINNGEVYTFADQDVLNIVMKNKTLMLPTDYNRLTALSVGGNEDTLVEEHTRIIHYITKNKPWHQPYRSKLYDLYLEKSPWRNASLILYNDKKTSSIRAYSRLMFKQKKYLVSMKHYLIYLRAKFMK
jgi:lipopolysaccharide biosynthesis glycosyltransferase